METIGLLFQYVPLWAQITILIVLLLSACMQIVEALIRAFVPHHPRSLRSRPVFHASRPVRRRHARRVRNVTP